jgi:phage terminase large subunit-like protein
MQSATALNAISAAALTSAASPLAPEPEWITSAADEHGYAWARLAWQRAAASPGAWFDAGKADAIIARWPTWFKLTVGRFAGIPFRLSFWQECIVRLLVGWKAPIDIIDPETGLPSQVHVRLFRELRLWVPRKNGKSEFLAALALLFWAIEGQRRGAGFCFAHDEAQAREVFDKMADMIGYAPSVFRSLETGEAIKVFSKQLWNAELRSPFRLMPGKAKGKHGRAPFVTVGDEMHEWISTRARQHAAPGRGRQPAADPALRLDRRPEIAKGRVRPLGGKPENSRRPHRRSDHAGGDFCRRRGCADWKDENAWRAANPSLGLSPTMAFLRGEIAKAVTPASEAAFRRYHLNQWVEDFARWITLKKWDAASPDREAWKRFPDELAAASVS